MNKKEIIMLNQPIMDKLCVLKLSGMQDGLREQMENSQYKKLSFEERFGLLLDREWDLRQTRKLQRRMRMARFREQAVMENLEISVKRGLDRKQVLYLAEGKWIHEKLNAIITGPTGAGKTYLSCALGNGACRNGYSVRYFPLSRLLGKLKLYRADGSYPRFLDQLAKTQLLILDDWLRNPLTETQKHKPMISSKSWRTDITITQPWWPHRFRLPNGMSFSEIQPWPMPSWIESYTMPIGWN
jgi:DNA replication protein DnaC